MPSLAAEYSEQWCESAEFEVKVSEKCFNNQAIRSNDTSKTRGCPDDTIVQRNDGAKTQSHIDGVHTKEHNDVIGEIWLCVNWQHKCKAVEAAKCFPGVDSVLFYSRSNVKQSKVLSSLLIIDDRPDEQVDLIAVQFT